MPASFDRATVTAYVANAEQKSNAQALKIGYFVRHSPKNFPVEDGLVLLENAISAETIGSRRWFVLRDIHAFGTVYGRKDGIQPGFDSYGVLFDQVAKAKASDAEDIVQNAIVEYIITLDGEAKRLKSDSDLALAQTTFLKAITAYFKLAKHDGPKVPWKRALHILGMNADTTTAVERGMAEATAANSVAALCSAAELFLPVNPQRSLVLLTKAEALVPPGDEKSFAMLQEVRTQALESGGQASDAIALLLKSAPQTGKGWAKLLMLAMTTANEDAFKIAVSALKQPNANEDEIVQAAAVLMKASRQRTRAALQPPLPASMTNQGVLAVDILQTYLSAPRPRTIEQELNARVFMVQYLLAQEKFDEAISMAELNPHQPPFASRFANVSYQALVSLSKTAREKKALKQN